MFDRSLITVNGTVLFERSSMPAGVSHAGSLDESACFMYMLKGMSNAIEPMGATSMRATEGLLKRCGNYVSQFFTDGNDSYCEGVAIYFNPDFIKKIYRHEIPNFLYKEAPSFNTKKVESNQFIQQYIDNLLPYFDQPDSMDEELATLKIKELVLILLRTESRESVIEFFSELFADPAKLKLVDVVENNIYSDISIEQLAFLCNMSLSTFKRTFKKEYEVAPATYIRSKKIEKAKNLLLQTDLQIQEVAYQSGFNELSAFSHTFQKNIGSSPSEFRMNQMNKSLN